MAKKERVLTEKEKRRAEKIEAITAEYQKNGFRRTDQTINMLLANIMSVVYGLILCTPIGFWFRARNTFNAGISTREWVIMVVIYVATIILHEGIHGCTWSFFAKAHMRSIEFGFIKESCTPYCYCCEPMKKGVYIVGLIMPSLLLGLVWSIIAVFVNSLPMLYLGFINLLGGGGDLTILIKMLLYRPDAREVVIMDHPTECGFITFEK